MDARCTTCSGSTHMRNQRGMKLSDLKCACGGKYERMSSTGKIYGISPDEDLAKTQTPYPTWPDQRPYFSTYLNSKNEHFLRSPEKYIPVNNYYKKQMSWWKPGIEGGGSSCLCCPQTVEVLPLETKLYNGFGGWNVLKNGYEFFQDDRQEAEWEEWKDISYIEKLIGEDTENEYLAQLLIPLRNATYQRHAKNHWVLIEKGNGFA